MCSLWRPFCDLRSAWSLEPSSLPHPQGLLVFQWEDFGDEVEISVRLGFSERFRISNHPSAFIISRLLSFHSPPNLKLQNVVRILRLFSAFLNDARQRNRKWDFFPVRSEIESGPTGKAGWHKSLRTPRGIPFPGVIISRNRLPGFSFTPYISVLRQNLLWLVWPMNLSVFAKTPSERMFLFSVFLSLLPVKV